ncbi:hypothetical protein HYPSUDRAFT_291676 [Hypholoma sublateritium FD-334 SS-4]|uniref:Uncharacterized protein n=1 Tax=Hypholoma sublateritium (strain FD-334 SS-4) TaxID=945553 RepID=A0A0D2KP73_HYPSF|nr:hypothetical protein HYPSUDRAFT_291676 [Hypholoma sublateritium FD-334 SS-4]
MESRCVVLCGGGFCADAFCQATPWVTADLPSPARFTAAATPPAQPITVDDKDSKDALTDIKFSWRFGLAHQLVRGVGLLLRGVGRSESRRRVLAAASTSASASSNARAGASASANVRGGVRQWGWRAQSPEDSVGVASAPERHRERDKGKAREVDRSRGKGKERVRDELPDAGHQQSSQQAKTLVRPFSKSARSLRALSPERWLAVRASSTSTGALPALAAGAGEARRTRKAPATTATTPASASSTSPSTSPSTATYTARTVAAAAARGAAHARAGVPETPIIIPSRRGSDAVRAISEPTSPTERRARFARLFNLAGWRTPRGTRAAGPGAGAGASGSAAATDGVPIGALAGLRSEEVLGRHFAGPASFLSQPGPAGAGAYDDEDDEARLTAAQRAASWGQGDTPEYAELASVQSVDPLDALPVAGAGGVFIGAGAGGGGGMPPVHAMMPDEEYARWGRPTVPLVYGAAEQAEDNLRFGQPAWHRSSSLDGSSEGGSGEVEPARRHVASGAYTVGGDTAGQRQGAWTHELGFREGEEECDEEHDGADDGSTREGGEEDDDDDSDDDDALIVRRYSSRRVLDAQ